MSHRQILIGAGYSALEYLLGKTDSGSVLGILETISRGIYAIIQSKLGKTKL